ncbi:MAG: patatin-like phospholipase family protein [Bacillota bacterium]|jgi:predicted acylesterase/phospholipase RssA
MVSCLETGGPDSQRSPCSRQGFTVGCACYVTATARGKPVRFHLNGRSGEQIYARLLASAAIPVLFPSVVIDRVEYLDGGIADNTPVEPLYDAGCRTIIVVYLDRFFPLPSVRFDESEVVVVRTDSYAKFTLNKGKHTYSSAPRYAKSQVFAKLTAHEVIVTRITERS